jgi:hypothetical protein
MSLQCKGPCLSRWPSVLSMEGVAKRESLGNMKSLYCHTSDIYLNNRYRYIGAGLYNSRLQSFIVRIVVTIIILS